MAAIDLTASGGSRAADAACNFARQWSGPRSAAAIAAVLAGAGGAAAQDAAFTSNFTNNTPYIGKVLSNTKTIDNNSTWLGAIVSNNYTINNNSGATWTGNVESNAERVTNLLGGTWLGSVKNQNDLKNFGTWTGDVLINVVKLENEVGATWYGDVYDNQYKFLNYGTWVGDLYAQTSTGELNSYGDWYGDVIGNSGTIYADGIWTGDILSNSYRIITNLLDTTSTETVWNGNVVTNDGIVSNYLNATWNGDVLDNLGSVRNYAKWNGDVSNRAIVDNRGGSTWTGDVVVNQGTVINFATAIWLGDVRSQTATGVLTNRSAWTGDVLTNAGSIVNELGAIWQGDVLDNAGAVSNAGAWTGDLTSRGSVSNTGVWTGDVLNTGAVFMAQNQFIGSFDNRGAVQLTGDLAISGLLDNSGRLQLTHTTGAQTLTVGGAEFDSTASYEIDVTAIGGSDLMLVTGAASLAGSVVVKTSTVGGGTFDDQKSYIILTAGSLEGSFAGVTTDLAFLSPHLSYDDTNVYLGLRRNDVGFADSGATGNQVGVSAAVEALGAGNALYDAVLWLTPEEARDAFDQLSGEAYGAAASAAIQGGGRFGDMVLSRLGDALPADDSAPGGPQLWAEAYGAGFASTGGVAALDTLAGGLVLGADAALGDWRLGALLQLGATAASAPALQTRITSTDYGAGLYAGTSWGATQLALGGIYTLHDTESSRSVSFPGFADMLAAAYQAETAQAFAELSHRVDLGPVALTPYAGLAQIRYTSAAFVETGGPAALTRDAYVLDATFTTLGLGLDHSIVVDGTLALTARASLGWRRGFGTTPESIAALDGAPAFAVTAAPFAGDLAVVSAGINLDVDAATELDLAYDGQFGTTGQSHSLRGTLATAF